MDSIFSEEMVGGERRIRSLFYYTVVTLELLCYIYCIIQLNTYPSFQTFTGLLEAANSLMLI